MKKFIIAITTIIAFIVILLILNCNDKKSLGTISGGTNEVGKPENPHGRAAWEINRLKDPATGRIPDNIRILEMEFASTLPVAAETKSVNWINRGPFNVGGRTRGAAMDINNENRILAGGINGGIWETLDGGSSWSKITLPSQLHSTTCILQDTRPGHTNTWYYGTGEAYGASAGATGAFFLGNGVFKSTDNGINWSSLVSTTSNTPQLFDKVFDLVWNMAIDPTIDTADIIYAACYGTILRSNDGGASWINEIGSWTNQAYFTDVAVAPNGIKYATVSSDGTTHGIYRSVDGLTWSNIIPAGFPPVHDRVVIGINPQNPNSIFFLGVTPGYGQMAPTWVAGETSWTSLWKYNYLNGDGTGTGGIWTDLSSGIPNNGVTTFDNFYAQGSYDLIVKVKPDDSMTVFIGGTNLYRSTDGFTTQTNVTQIGGYELHTSLPDFHVYLNHHPDQHNLFFLPSNPSIMFSCSDGGIHRTQNCMAPVVVWESLNQGYLTTQAYTINADDENVNDILVAGFQDNGNYFTNSPNPTASWVMPLNGDGAFSAIAENGNTYYLSIQNGRIYKMSLNTSGQPTGFARIDPIGASGYDFINPFVVDPNDPDVMYVPAGKKMWRNDSLTHLPLAGNYDSISTGWMAFTDTLLSGAISAVAVTKNPAHRLYYGTSFSRLYKIENANTGTPSRTEITYNLFPTNANISCIAPDPYDGNKIAVAFSNYGVYSLFYTPDGGTTWQKVAGNLEQVSTGGGNGPSFRWVSILPSGYRRLYLVGTSTGLYGTDTLTGLTTQWVQLGSTTIGNIVVDMIKTREADGLVAIATHGNGIYSTNITNIEDIFVTINEAKRNCFSALEIYPNPASFETSLRFDLKEPSAGTVTVYSSTGKVIDKNNYILAKGINTITMNVSGYNPGIYLCAVQFGTLKKIVKLIVQK